MSTIETTICILFNSSSLKPQGIGMTTADQVEPLQKLVDEHCPSDFKVVGIDKIATSTLIAIVIASYAEARANKFKHYTNSRVDYEAALVWLADRAMAVSC